MDEGSKDKNSKDTKKVLSQKLHLKIIKAV